MTSITADRRRNSLGEIDYECPTGHRVHGENVLWRSNGKNQRTPTCKKCRSYYRAENRKKNKFNARAAIEKTAVPLQYDSYGELIPWEECLGIEKRSAPWNLLRPSFDASAVFDDFHEALLYTDVPCRGREAEFTDYQDPRASLNEDNDGRPPMPGREQARLLCAGCPLIEQCRAYAHADKPDFGVWGGERYLGGKVI